MAQESTAYEVLETAEMMERSAARFYRKAAGLYDDPRISKLFSELAQWEKRHVRVFANLRQHLSQWTWDKDRTRDGERAGTRFRGPEADGADTAVTPALSASDAQADPARGLTGRESRADVLRMAIQKEKAAIAYYTGLKGCALGKRDLEVLKEVIREEDRHVRILAQSLGQLA